MVGRQVLKRLKQIDTLPESLSKLKLEDDNSYEVKQERIGNRFSFLEVQDAGDDIDEEAFRNEPGTTEPEQATEQYGSRQARLKHVGTPQEETQHLVEAENGRLKSQRGRRRKMKRGDTPVELPVAKANEEGSDAARFWLPVSAKRLDHQSERNQRLGIRSSTNKGHSAAGIARRNQVLVSATDFEVPAIEIAMNCIDDGKTYKYEHLSAYREIEQSFIDNIQSVATPVSFIQQHYNHANSMLLLSEIFATHEEYETASEMIERCICLLQKRFHPHFQLQCDSSEKPTSRAPSLLPYKYYENRIFHIALFRHALFLHNRSLSRGALEVAKILLNTDPSDPLAVVLVIDLYASRAGEFQFLISFYEQCREIYFLDNLPGMAFHRALALLKLDRHDEAKEAMRSAIRRFPNTFQLLLDRLSVEPDSKMGRVLSSLPEDPTALKILSFLFVDRIYRSAWTSQDVLHFMEESARDVVPIENSKNELYLGTTPDRVRRHVALSAFMSDSIKRALQAMLTERREWREQADAFDPMYIFNPFPPSEDPVGPYIYRREKSNKSLVAAFLESMLPNNEHGLLDRVTEIIDSLRGSQNPASENNQE